MDARGVVGRLSNEACVTAPAGPGFVFNGAMARAARPRPLPGD
ncbi:MAG: hypothetical protein AAB368_10210 [bacterium]